MIIDTTPNKLTTAIAGASIGDTIRVGSGTLTPATKLIINKPLKLYSNGCIIDGTNTVHGRDWESGLVELLAKGITFSGFKVQNSKIAGIFAKDASNLIVDRNKIHNCYGSGLEVHNGSNIKVFRNELSQVSYKWVPSAERQPPQECVSIAGSNTSMDTLDGLEVAYNYIHDSGMSDAGVGGIYLKQGISNANIHHNYVYKVLRGNIYSDTSYYKPAGATQYVGKNNDKIHIHENLIEASGCCGVGVSTEWYWSYGHGGQNNNNIVENNILWKNAIGIHSSGSYGDNGTIANLKIINNLVYGNKNGIHIGRGLKKIPTWSGLVIKDNGLKNTASEIVIDPRIPASAYTISGTYIPTEAQATAKYNALKAAIFAGLTGNCQPVWTCEQPLNGYESDGCGNRRLNSQCNPITISRYKCVNGQCVTTTETGTGTYATLAECQSNCQDVTPKYKCLNGQCVRDDINGTYLESTCGGNCNPDAINRYKCVNGQCVTTTDTGTGTYATLAECQPACGQQPPSEDDGALLLAIGLAIVLL